MWRVCHATLRGGQLDNITFRTSRCRQPAMQSDDEGLVLASDQDHHLSHEGRSRIKYGKEANRGDAENDEEYMHKKAKGLSCLE